MPMPKKPRTPCISCGVESPRPKQIYCSIQCQQDYQYRLFVERWQVGLEDGSVGDLGISNHIRRYLRNKYGDACARCGWNEQHPDTGEVPIEIHHVNGNGTDHREENLTLLCPNCHSLTPTYRGRNKGKGRVKRK
jgi:hypothetical protein